jgi:hypothetical protein
MVRPGLAILELSLEARNRSFRFPECPRSTAALCTGYFGGTSSRSNTHRLSLWPSRHPIRAHANRQRVKPRTGSHSQRCAAHSKWQSSSRTARHRRSKSLTGVISPEHRNQSSLLAVIPSDRFDNGNQRQLPDLHKVGTAYPIVRVSRRRSRLRSKAGYRPEPNSRPFPRPMGSPLRRTKAKKILRAVHAKHPVSVECGRKTTATGSRLTPHIRSKAGCHRSRTEQVARTILQNINASLDPREWRGTLWSDRT